MAIVFGIKTMLLSQRFNRLTDLTLNYVTNMAAVECEKCTVTPHFKKWPFWGRYPGNLQYTLPSRLEMEHPAYPNTVRKGR